MRRVAVFSSAATDTSDPEGQANIDAFLQVLQQFGWTRGQNVQIDHRVGGNNAERMRKQAAELAALAPDVIISAGASSMGPLLQATRSVPVVFVNVADPVGAGYAESLGRPGGNATGFMAFEYSLSGKWLELLKQIAPAVTRAGILRDAAITSGTGQFAVIQSVAPSVGIDVSPISVRDAGEIERGVAAFARSANGGLIVTASAATVFHREQIIMVRKALKVNSALELAGASVCVQQGTTTELNLADFFSANKMQLKSVTFATANEAVKAYDAGRCDAYTTDASALYAERLRVTNPDDHVILPEIISKEPLGPVVRHGDDQWFDIVKWTLFAMIDAEELSISQKTLDEAMKSPNPEVKRFVGTEGNYGEQLGLAKDWAVQIVKQVGNYGESFERNVGMCGSSVE